MMKTTKLFDKFGLKINNFDVTTLEGESLEQILSLLEQYGLLVFRKQCLDDRDLYEFSSKIGKLEESARKICLSQENSQISNLTNLRDTQGNPLGFPGNKTDFWHSDQEFRENPATLATLYCVFPSPIGGTTSFASTAVSNLNLPTEILENIRNLQVTYIPAPTHDNVGKVEVVHPFLLTSPRSGKETVYVSENTKKVIGLNLEEGKALKAKLLERIIDKENIYSHVWKTGDLILYDNTQLLHRRDEFEGIRWLKATKIFAHKEKFAVPWGKLYETNESNKCERSKMYNSEIKSLVATVSAASKTSHSKLKELVAKSYGHYGSDPKLSIPKPQLIRAGKAGGLPFDSLTTDLQLGCLPASQICYGNCFAARGAFQSGFNFGKHVENILDEDVLKSDLKAIPESQAFLRNGWNSDPSWNWEKGLRLAELIHEAGKHTIFITKCFVSPDEDILSGFAALGVELRVSISAFDSEPQLEQRLQTIENYRKQNGVAVPLVMTTKFKDQTLNDRQDKIVQYVVEQDLPASENSLRFDLNSPVVELIDESVCGYVTGTGDLWCGRLYSDQILRVPTTTTLPSDYRGLQSPNLSENDPEFLKSLWHEPVRTHAEVKSKPSLNKPSQCGVAIEWKQIDKAIL
jgi:alpha-ketoglutarate-dependent taurine dioxygenase